jgi:chromosome segregation and condensation protein ScpB
VSDSSSPGNDGQPLETLVETQALSLDLRVAVMACLSGAESRRWTVLELAERFKALGICASRAGVTAALADLELELELCAWAPWRLIERGTEWFLAPKSEKAELLALLCGVRKLPVPEPGKLSQEHRAVLLVVIGYRRKGGVSKTRLQEILDLEPSSYLDDLLGQELIYADPGREFNFWRPTSAALLALGLRSSSDIPALRELEQRFDALASRREPGPQSLDSYFARTKKLQSRRLKRELERRESLPG